MSEMSADQTSKCAACGKASDDLKTCSACQSIQYCSATCQKAHRKRHKLQCQILKAELVDEVLFKQPPPRDDCPICFLPLPTVGDTYYMNCCGKSVCDGCHHAVDSDCCAFCREPHVVSDQEIIARCRKRVQADDAGACTHFGNMITLGHYGLDQDYKEALRLFERAIGLGSTDAHFHIGCLHHDERFLPQDWKKAVYHWQKAAIGGHEMARFNLGCYESSITGDIERSVRHFMILAKCGNKEALDRVQQDFSMGRATKAQFRETLRGYQKSEVRSAQRENAAAVERSMRAFE